MARFTVRVELHDGTWEDYVRLYEEMDIRSFTDTIKTDNGGAVKMPPGEYNYEGPSSKEQVLELAKAAASQVVHSYGVLVTESNGTRKWHGLKSA